MIKKIILFVISIISILFTYNYLTKEKEIIVDRIPNYYDSVYLAIESYNQNCHLIKSIIDDKLKIYSSSLGFNGFLAYEKDKKTRLIVSSIFGKEIDFGSNSQEFWFWIKRMSNGSLLYANHEDLYKTRLELIFDPNFLTDCLLVDKINLDKKTLILKPDDQTYKVITAYHDPSKDLIYKVILINKADSTIHGKYYYDKNFNILASVEAISYYKVQNIVIPKKLRLFLKETNTEVFVEFIKPQLNHVIDPSMWQKPSISPKINLAN